MISMDHLWPDLMFRHFIPPFISCKDTWVIIIHIQFSFVCQEVVRKSEMTPFTSTFVSSCFSFCSTNTSAKSPETGAHNHRVTDFTNAFGFKLAPRNGPRAKQLTQKLPGGQQQPLFLSCSLPNAKNPQLCGAERNLQVQDLPPCQTEQQGPQPARDRPAGGLHPHPTLKAGRRRSRAEAWHHRKPSAPARRHSWWCTSAAWTWRRQLGLFEGQDWWLRKPRI